MFSFSDISVLLSLPGGSACFSSIPVSLCSSARSSLLMQSSLALLSPPLTSPGAQTLMLFLCSFGTCSSPLGYISVCFAEAQGGFTLQERGLVHKLPRIPVRGRGRGEGAHQTDGAGSTLPAASVERLSDCRKERVRERTGRWRWRQGTQASPSSPAWFWGAAWSRTQDSRRNCI